MLALAFYHSHESAIRDISKYETLEDRAGDEAIPTAISCLPEDVMEEMKKNVTKQAGLQWNRVARQLFLLKFFIHGVYEPVTLS